MRTVERIRNYQINSTFFETSESHLSRIQSRKLCCRVKVRLTQARIFAESFIFCDGVPEWWRLDVPHPAKWSIHREASEVLRR
jgi:hypothetical protein